MAPLGTLTAAAASSAAAAMRARSRSRSRSPEPKALASSSSRGAGAAAPPNLKDWVLVRVGTRFWSKAVPALVSKVTVGIKEEDCSLCLVLPNRFALQYGFGTAKPFLELSDVPVRDVRRYHGKDHVQLHAALLKAIRISRTAPPASREVPVAATGAAAASNDVLPAGFAASLATTAALTKVVLPAVPDTQDDIPLGQPEPMELSQEDGGASQEGAPAEPRSLPEPTGMDADGETEESEPTLAAAPASTLEKPSAESSEPEDVESTQEVPLEEQLASGPGLEEEQEQPLEEAEPSPSEAPATSLEVPPPPSPQRPPRSSAGDAPETPQRAAQGRPLAQRTSEPKDVSNVVAEPVVVPVGKIASVVPVAEKAAPAPAPVNARARFMELTKAVARAFKGAGAEELTKQELAKAVGCDFGEEELQQGLEQLDQAQKIFLTGDLVFLV